MTTVSIFAHAKVNLFLRVLAREASGFHAIETLFTLLDLADTLTMERVEEGIALEVRGANLGPSEENLAYRAAQLVLDATGNRFGVRITLEKRIPVEAGLGGGSSDAAAALHAANKLAHGAVPTTEILQMAARLGSDVPFFASGAAMALGWGRGDRLFRLPAPPSAPVLLVVPTFGISTAKAYQLLDARSVKEERRGPVVLDESVVDTWGHIGRLGGNDFENVVFGEEPQLRELYVRMAETRPLLVRLSGSGSALIAVYKSERERDDAALELGEREWRLIRTATRQQPAAGVS